jgi:thioredoxin reductase (NADPH)
VSPVRPAVRIVGRRLEPEDHRLRDFLTASDGLSTVVFERDAPGGQASHTSLIENFFGFPDGIGGAELSRLAGRQAEKFGAELMLLHGIRGSRLNNHDEKVELVLEDGSGLTGWVVLAATGMDWRRLEIDGIDELLDRGVYYGAGRSEAAQCSASAWSWSAPATQPDKRCSTSPTRVLG